MLKITRFYFIRSLNQTKKFSLSHQNFQLSMISTLTSFNSDFDSATVFHIVNPLPTEFMFVTVIYDITTKVTIK